MELMKQNIHMECLKCKATTQITLDGEVIIPDSRMDVAKLIMDRGNVVIEEVKASDDHVNLKGKLMFRVLYLADGGKVPGAEIADMEGSIPFTESVFMENVKNTDAVNVDWSIEDLSISMIHSRKLQVQSVITLELGCRDMQSEEVAVDLFSDEPVEFRKKKLEAATLMMKKRDVYRIKEEVEIPSSFPNIFALIWSEAVPASLEFKILEDKISIQGELRTFFLYRGEGEDMEICHYETTLPFAGTLDCPGCREGMIPEITYRAQDRQVNVRPDYDGEERILTFELCLDLNIAIYEEESIDLLSDVYGVVNEVNTREKTMEFKSLAARCSGKTKLSDHFKADEGVTLHKILHTDSQLHIAEQKFPGNGVELIGHVELQIFYESTGNEKYGVIEGTIPFQYVLEANDTDENCTAPVKVFIDQLTVSIIDTGEVDVKCVLFFQSNIYREWKENVVEEILVYPQDAEKMAALPSIAVYMVREGESLWDIGKRYYVPISVIKKTNELATDEVSPGDRILIVKGN